MIIISTVAELLVRISGDSSGLQKELAASQRQLKRAFGSDAMSASQNIVTGMGLVAAALGGVGVAAVKMSSEMEQNRMAFTTMLGSAQAAERMLTELATFAAKTPFEFTSLVTSTRQLLAYGYAAEEVIPMLTKIGDAASAFGATGDAVDRIVLAFGQMKAKGFISGEEMRQLASAGLPAWQMLATAIGKTIPEAMKLAEEKALNAEAAMAGMLEQMASKYGGMMQKQSGTVLGIISNIKDQSGIIMRAMGDEIIEALDLKNKLRGSLAFLEEFASKVKSSGVQQAFSEMLPPGLETTIYAISGALMFAMIPALEAAAIKAYALLVALGPLGIAGAAVGIALSNLKDVAPDARSEMDKLALSTVLTGEAFDNAAASVSRFNASVRGSVPGAGSPEEYFAGTGATPSKKAGSNGPMITGGSGGKDPVKEAERVSDAIEREWAQTTKSQLEQLDIWQRNQLDDLEKTKSANENYERDRERVMATFATRRLKIEQETAQKSREISDSVRDAANGMMYDTNGTTGNAAELMKLEKAHEEATNSIGDKWDKLAERFATSTAAEKEVFLKNLNERRVAYETLANGEIAFEANKNAELAKLDEQYNQDLIDRKTACKDVLANIDAAYRANSMSALQAALNEENAIRLNDYEAQQSMMQTYQEAALAANMSWQAALMNVTSQAFAPLKSAISDMLTGAKSIGEAFAAMGKAVLKSIADIVAGWIAGQITMMAINALSKALGLSDSKSILATSVAQGAATAAAWAPAAAMVSLATMGQNAIPAGVGIAAVTGMAMLLAGVGVSSGKGDSGGDAYSTASGIPRMASGGYQNGPGTGTSDSILSWLSNGEYVIQASSVRKFGTGIFDMLNSGRMPALATRGIVTGPSLGMMRASTFLPSISLSNRVFGKLADKFSGGEASQITQNVYGDIRTEADYERLFDDLGNMVSVAMMG